MPKRPGFGQKRAPSAAIRQPLFDLNLEQEQAVRQVEGPVLILAGAGTGKTRVVTARAAWMIDQGIDPKSILAVTFTNKAALEMRERLVTLVSPEEARSVTMSTFHALCLRVLRRDVGALGHYKNNFSIYDQGDQLGLLRKIIVRVAGKDGSLDPNTANALISRAKGQPGDPSDHPVIQRDPLLREIFNRYDDELRRFNAVDFDDLLRLTLQLFNEQPEKLQYWRDRFRYLMVDEFQDTNRMQLEIVVKMAGPAQNVCVVGDDDQSIYGWRGAEVSNILDFETHFPQATVIKLEQNYRSTSCILQTANGLIRNNPRRRPKELWSALGEGEKVRLIAMPDDKTEAEFIVNEICARQLSGEVPWESVAIIYRTNAQSRLLETQLRKLNVPYRLVGGKSFFDRREVKDFLAYLKVLINLDDDTSLLRIINTPARGISDATVQLALQYSVEQKCSLHQALIAPALQTELGDRAASAVSRFLEFVDDYETRLFAFQADYAAVMLDMMEACRYFDDLKRSCRTAEEGEERERAVREVISGLKDFQESSQGEPREFIDQLSLDSDWAQRNKDKKEQGQGVTLITMHAVKGLEFPHVYIIGLEEGILPHTRSKEEGTIDEERRLLYVGITRAQRTLALTYCHSRRKHGEDMPCHPSSFLDELPENCLEVIDYHALQAAPAEEDTARNRFALLRQMME